MLPKSAHAVQFVQEVYLGKNVLLTMGVDGLRTLDTVEVSVTALYTCAEKCMRHDSGKGNHIGGIAGGKGVSNSGRISSSDRARGTSASASGVVPSSSSTNK